MGHFNDGYSAGYHGVDFVIGTYFNLEQRSVFVNILTAYMGHGRCRGIDDQFLFLPDISGYHPSCFAPRGRIAFWGRLY